MVYDCEPPQATLLMPGEDMLPPAPALAVMLLGPLAVKDALIVWLVVTLLNV